MKRHGAAGWLVVVVLALPVVFGLDDGGAAALHPGHSAVAETAADSASLPDLPAAAQAQISAALGRDQSSYHATPHADGFRLDNPKHRLAADFTPAAVRVFSGSASWGLSLVGYGYGDDPPAAMTVAPQAMANQVEYRRGNLTEWYLNGPLGLEQGFTLAKPPGERRGEPLTLVFSLSGNLTASTSASEKDLLLSRVDGTPALRYRGLTAHDATGRELRAWLRVDGQRLWLRVDDERARYPLVIDPFIEQAKLTAFDGAAGDRFGLSVSVSGDTVVVGAPLDDTGFGPGNQGSVYIFVRPAGGWSRPVTQPAKLLASDRAGGDQFGSSVAVDGDTVVVGAPFDDIFVSPTNRINQGSAYVFVKPAGGWSGTPPPTAKLTVSDGAANDFFGLRVAISGDTVVVGVRLDDVGTNIDQGSAYVFVKPAAGWSNRTQDAKLTAFEGAAGDQFGNPVAVSGDTIVVAAPLDDVGANADQGSAYVFVKPPGGWSADRTENAMLIASDPGTSFSFPDDAFGSSVAVSGDTIVVGAHFGDRSTVFRDTGAAYVFLKPALGWSGPLTEDAKLTASDGAFADQFGTAVAASGDVIVVGVGGDDSGANRNQGSVYVFEKPGPGWSGTLTETAKLTALDGAALDLFGNSVAVSGGTIVVGAPLDDVGPNADQGSVYVFVGDHILAANAGADQTVTEGTVVTLDGTASTGQNLIFAWQQIAGPSVELSDPTSPTPSFTAPPLTGESQVLTFQLTVTSGTLSSSDTVDVTVVRVNHAPVAEAGADQTVNEASLVALNGSASFDPDGDATSFMWIQTGGTQVLLTGAETAQPSFTAPLLSGGTGESVTLTFDLTVSDGALSGTDTVQVIVEQVNHAPVANAGPDQTKNEGTLVALNGAGSSDPDGDLLSFAWSQPSGPLVTLSDAHSPTPSFMAPSTGPGGATLVFELTVSDGFLSNDPAPVEPDERVTINVVNLNDPPLCSAARASPDRLWPPNHKMTPVGITGVADPDNDQVQITIIGITQDEPLIGLGDGDTSPDAVPQGDTALLRAERSGNGNGRVYRITFTAGDTAGGSCTGSVVVGVPHSMKPGGSPVDDGQLYDSTLP